MRETDTLVSTVDEIRPDIGVPHHVRRNRVERGTSTTLSEPFTIRSRETYRFHGSDPLPFHQGSLVDALFTTHVCVCLRFLDRSLRYVSFLVRSNISHGWQNQRVSCSSKKRSPFFDAISFSPLVSQGNEETSLCAANSKWDVLLFTRRCL